MEDGITHILAIQHTSSLFVDDFSLLIHNLVVLQQILTNCKVIALNLLLSFLNRTGKHLMLDLLAFFYSKRLKHLHQSLRAEQSHQVIFQRNVESRFSRISLTSGTAT